MAETEEQSEHPPDVDLGFSFAEGWPDAVIGQCQRLFGFDLAEVRGTERLGALAFDQAPRIVEEIRSIIRDLAKEPWRELPEVVTGGLDGQVGAVSDALEKMSVLTSEQGNAPAEKQNLDGQLQSYSEWFRSTARPHAVRALVDRRLGERPEAVPEVEQLDHLREEFSQLSTEATEVRRELEARRDLVNQFREAARESAGEELSGVFQARAREHASTAQGWFYALIGAGLAALAGAIVTFLALRPDEAADDASDFAALGLGLFILGLLVFGVRVCAQNYRVNRHLEAIARSKAAALSTFQRLASSVEEEEIRSAVTLALAQAVFETGETGLIDSSGDHVTLVERAVLSSVTSSSRTT